MIPAIGASKRVLHAFGALATLFAAAAHAQSICFDPIGATYPLGSLPSDLRLFDIDGDTIADLVTTSPSSADVTWFPGSGNGTFGQPTTSPLGGFQFPTAFIELDVDGDGDLDLAVALAQPTAVGILTNGGNGTFSQAGFHPTGSRMPDIAKGDLDHDGDLDLVTASYDTHGVDVLRNLGNGTFAPPVHTTTQLFPNSVDLADMNADGHVDIVVGILSAAGSGNPGYVAVLFNDGAGGFSSFPALHPVGHGALACAVGDIDGDGDRDIAAAVDANPFSVRVYRNEGVGQFNGPYTDVPVSSVPFDVALFDADADGDLDLFVATYIGTDLLENDGTGAYSLHGSLPALGSASTVTVGDMDGDGHADLGWTELQPNSVRVRLSCATNGIPFCFGDGTGTPCPCGNASAIGAQSGCLHSFGTAGELVSTGTPSVAGDTVTLAGSGMTNGQALYFQGVSAVNGGPGAAFGDGLRCAGGTTIRLGIKLNVSGASHYPVPGDAAVSVRGAVPAGTTRFYQVLYRNIASFCTSATFNLSNGLRITWSP